MGRVAEKIAVSLDGELLARAERLRRTTGESRSGLIGRALRDLLAVEAHRRRALEYVEAYERMPERAAEVEAARALAVRSLSALPWDETGNAAMCGGRLSTSVGPWC